MQIINNPTGNINNIDSTTGWCMVSTPPTWNPDIDAISSKLAYDPNTGLLWTWQTNLAGSGDGAWALKSLISKESTNTVPTHTPFDSTELIINTDVFYTVGMEQLGFLVEV